MAEPSWQDEPEPEAQPQEQRVPPGPPPKGTQIETPDAPSPGWSFFETLPVVAFILLMAGLGMVPGKEPPATTRNVLSILILQSFFYAALLLYMVYIVHGKHGLPFWRGLGWRYVNPAFFLTCGLVLAIAVQLLSLPQNKPLPIERLFQTRAAVWMLAIFGTAVAPLVEEIIFRGFIFGAVERSSGLRTAVWSTALLFAAIHVPQLRGGTPQIIAIFAVGLTLSWARAKTRSLAAAYFMHLGYNATLFLILFAASQGFRNMNAV